MNFLTRTLKKVDEAITALRQNPRPRGVEKLDKTAYRIRVGRHRVIYDIYDKE
ncbi:type II toxin-antitoxin system RelE/ParE family toxin [bacterium]|nr:type II toxin-antitoxin system RelE/ParE family toxin [bacterium]